MTKEDALKALQNIRNMFKKGEASYVVLLNPQLIDVAIEALKNQSTVDAIPVSYFASELAEIKLILKRKDISKTYREELEAEKRYLVGWINHWRWETERGCKGLTFKPLSDDEIIDAEREDNGRTD